MVHAGDALGLHEVVVQQAKELFAAFHEDRELVQQFKGVISACLSESFDQASRDQVLSAAFRMELKVVIGREYVKKRMERRDESTKARLEQMNGKMWLQKRVQ